MFCFYLLEAGKFSISSKLCIFLQLSISKELIMISAVRRNVLGI